VPVPEPHLKSIPSVRVSPMMDSMLSWTELMKQAEHCGLGWQPTLNQTGELKAIFLLDQQVSELVAESVARGGIGEIAALFTPADDGVHHAADQLAHGAFALGSAGLAVEVFAGDDIGGGLRPVFWNFDVFLFEDRGALFVADQSGALLPFDLIEWRNLSIREETFKNQDRWTQWRCSPISKSQPLCHLVRASP